MDNASSSIKRVIKSGKRIIRPTDEEYFEVRRERRTTKNSLSKIIMSDFIREDAYPSEHAM